MILFTRWPVGSMGLVYLPTNLPWKSNECSVRLCVYIDILISLLYMCIHPIKVISPCKQKITPPKKTPGFSEPLRWRYRNYYRSKRSHLLWQWWQWCTWAIWMHTPYPYHLWDPWDWYIYLHEWLISMVNVGEYTSPMDEYGLGIQV